MLPKIWKKVLLAVCIIACIFNLMIKLVNRHSLESNLKKANDGNTILDSIKKDEKKQENLKSVNNIEDDYKNEDKIEENTRKDNTEKNEDQQKEENKTYKYTDFTVTF